MPHLHIQSASNRAVIRIAAILLLASAAADPESLPRPRAKQEAPHPDGRCDQCGSCEGVRKVGVPKMIEKEIREVCWDAKCEDFCIPGPSVWCGKACKQDDCGCWTHDLWKPTCAEVKTRVAPVRKETKRKVPAVEGGGWRNAVPAAGANPATWRRPYYSQDTPDKRGLRLAEKLKRK